MGDLPIRHRRKPACFLVKKSVTEFSATYLDDSQGKKFLLSYVLNAAKLKELPAFTAILKAKPHGTFGDYFIFLISTMEEQWGSRTMVGILQWFADAGVDITTQLKTYSLEPLAAVAKFKSLVRRFNTLVQSGQISAADTQRVRLLIDDAQMTLRGIEGGYRKLGQARLMGGVATVAGALWATTAALAADDVTVIGVADDVLIPFVVIGAVVLSGIALFTGGPKPEILDYSPAKAKINAALLATAAATPGTDRTADEASPQAEDGTDTKTTADD